MLLFTTPSPPTPSSRFPILDSPSYNGRTSLESPSLKRTCPGSRPISFSTPSPIKRLPSQPVGLSVSGKGPRPTGWRSASTNSPTRAYLAHRSHNNNDSSHRSFIMGKGGGGNDDGLEAVFNTSRVARTPATPVHQQSPSRPLSPKPKRRSLDLSGQLEDVPKLVLTPSPVMPKLALPQTPAQNDSNHRHTRILEDMRNQSESMRKLSLRDDGYEEPESPTIFGGPSINFGKGRKRTKSTLVHHRRTKSGEKASLNLPSISFSRSTGGLPSSSSPFRPSSPFFVHSSSADIMTSSGMTLAHRSPPSTPSPSPSPPLPPTTSANTFPFPPPSVIKQKRRSVKAKPRDSGVAGLSFSFEEDGDASMSFHGDESFHSALSSHPEDEANDSFVTPALYPLASSGWPGPDEDQDTYIFNNMAARRAEESSKPVMPDTPVKKGGAGIGLGLTGWQTMGRLGAREDTSAAKAGNAPRKSLPLKLLPLAASSPNVSTPDSPSFPFTSPSDRPRKSYGMLGGAGRGVRPSLPGALGGLELLRRTSSGAYSFSSESSQEGTPSAASGMINWGVPFTSTPPRPRGGPPIALNLPRNRSSSSRFDFVKPSPGKFEREFTSVESLGKGTFGQAFKVIQKHADDEGENKKVFAVKRSKQFEGVKHRLRLLEEVDILRHLSTPIPHRNVLHFVDGWEQDQMLYIQTELCELGNLADFLLEFGITFNRLDEPRLWKILSELGNGLRHIHDSNIIHLDLKPANIFVTLEGTLRIGDFGMASRWPRVGGSGGGFEREGDREYMAPEILKGNYGPEADIFSFGMIMLECAGNIVVPDMGEPWHNLRSGDFTSIDLSGLSSALVQLITQMMSPSASDRPTIEEVCEHEVVQRATEIMESRRFMAGEGEGGEGVDVFRSSAFGREGEEFMDLLFGGAGNAEMMDVGP